MVADNILWTPNIMGLETFRVRVSGHPSIRGHDRLFLLWSAFRTINRRMRGKKLNPGLPGWRRWQLYIRACVQIRRGSIDTTSAFVRFNEVNGGEGYESLNPGIIIVKRSFHSDLLIVYQPASVDDRFMIKQITYISARCLTLDYFMRPGSVWNPVKFKSCDSKSTVLGAPGGYWSRRESGRDPPTTSSVSWLLTNELCHRHLKFIENYRDGYIISH